MQNISSVDSYRHTSFVLCTMYSHDQNIQSRQLSAACSQASLKEGSNAAHCVSRQHYASIAGWHMAVAAAAVVAEGDENFPRV